LEGLEKGIIEFRINKLRALDLPLILPSPPITGERIKERGRKAIL